jgi:hypothetical protein
MSAGGALGVLVTRLLASRARHRNDTVESRPPPLRKVVDRRRARAGPAPSSAFLTNCRLEVCLAATPANRKPPFLPRFRRARDFLRHTGAALKSGGYRRVTSSAGPTVCCGLPGVCRLPRRQVFAAVTDPPQARFRHASARQTSGTTPPRRQAWASPATASVGRSGLRNRRSSPTGGRRC